MGRGFRYHSRFVGVRVYLIKGVCPQLLTNEGQVTSITLQLPPTRGGNHWQ